ncbi:MAG: glyoxalase [Alphaproteobacteria bacterium]|nr:glyoxalase [Alphaproteobacteria bacterium]
MAKPVTWFEIMGENADALRGFYSELFNWNFNVLEGLNYGTTKCDDTGIPGGVGQAPQGRGWVTFYVQTDDIEATLAQATALGGAVVMPARALPDKTTIAILADPEGHAVGVVQPATA